MFERKPVKALIKISAKAGTSDLPGKYDTETQPAWLWIRIGYCSPWEQYPMDCAELGFQCTEMYTLKKTPTFSCRP